LYVIEREEKCVKPLLRTSERQRLLGYLDVNENFNVTADLKLIGEGGVEFSNPS